MKQFLAISAIGTDRTGMVHELTKVIADCGASLSESRMIALGSEFAALLLVSGHWHVLARLETELKKLADAGNFALQSKRTEERAARTEMLPYSVDVVCLDQAGIVAKLSGFFSTRSIEITELNTRSYFAAHTGAAMFAVQMLVSVPSRIQIAVLREDFMDFCDHLNLDAILEPVKT
jgi:glycine cleavage system transcriptional repressor